ncbi:hypothetical protein [Natronococcus wangiae]|uniref:hypothetical protein n=1 Tax=Natronococcus wangiae TaxID=3068275 RepID=UPI00273FF545|nr:hypothetical protein [Natronococcus sp. AD5]
MAETEQERSLSELVVKELVEQGMDSPMRDSILEAVEESEGAGAGGSRTLPLAGALLGLGAAVGFVAGRESAEMEETPLEDIQEPEIIEDITEETEVAEETETEEPVSSSDRLSRLLLALGILAGIAVLRRRFAGGEDEEWEPIEEFKPATDIGEEEGEEAEEAEEEEEAEEAEEEEEADEETEVEEAETGEETEE